ncbi:MAG: copper resistance protein CopC [Geminicoccaceae bacterium]
MSRILLLLLLLAPLPAGAHAVLVGSKPASGERVDALPLVRLQFNEPVAQASVRLLDESGTEVQAVLERSDSGKVLTLRPDATPATGRYTVTYRLTSADGHPVVGAFPIGLGVPAGTATAASDDPALWLTFWFWLGAVLLAAGLVLAPTLLGPEAPRVGGASLHRLAAAVLATTLARAAAVATALSGVSLLQLATWTEFAGTTTARSTIAALIGAACLGLGWPRAAAALLILAPALSGHVITTGPTLLMGACVAAHTLLAALWLGALPTLLWAARRPAVEAVPVFRRFSAFAPIGVALLAALGLVMAWAQGVRLNWTPYEGWLASKLVLVGLMLLAAALIRWRLVPAFEGGSAVPLRRALVLDMVLATGVVAATAGLGTVPPPRATRALAAPHTLHLASREQQALLTLQPEGPGYRLELNLLNPSRPPLEARLRLDAPALGILNMRVDLKAVRPDLWTAALTFPAPGTWRIGVDLRVDDFTLDKLSTEVEIP